MDPVSVLAMLEAHAVRQPDAPAAIRHEQVTGYAELVDRIIRLAAWLVRNGLTPGEPAAITVRDEIDHLAVAMALLCLASDQINLPEHETGANRRALAGKVSAGQVVADRIEDWMTGMTVLVPPFTTLPPAQPDRSTFAPLPADATPLFQNTSGSTGVPKTIVIPLRRMLTMAERYSKEPHARRVLRGSTMAFNSTRLQRICLILAGNTNVFSPNLTAENLAGLCAGAEVSALHIGTYPLASLLSTPARVGRLPSYTQIYTGGSRVPGQLRATVRSLLTPNLWVHYATSEIGGISRASPDEHEAHPEGVGHPIPNVTVEIVDESGAILKPGAIGQARVMKTSTPKCYVGSPEPSSSFRDGAFYPGDLLSHTDDGTLIYHGRADDLMILGGINILPAAIEDRLECHPDVREAVAFPIASRIHGEIPVAAVVLTRAGTPPDTNALVGYCRAALGLRGPRQIIVVERIPRNQAGKPLRRQLAAEHGGRARA